MLFFFVTARTTEGAMPAPQKPAEATQRREFSTDSQPIIRTAPSRQGKRQKKSSVEKNIAALDRASNFHEDEDSVNAVVTNKQRVAVKASEWSHSSASEAVSQAVVSQGQMELLLVVR